MNNTIVIYHSNCTDGFGAAFIAYQKFGHTADYIACNYGPQADGFDVEQCRGKNVYIVDFSFPLAKMKSIINAAASLTWLDHHKTAFEMCPDADFAEGIYKLNGMKSTIVLDNNKSGAMLAWEFFNQSGDAPMWVRHVDDYDRWQFKLSGTKEFHTAIGRYRPFDFDVFGKAVSDLHSLYDEGALLLEQHKGLVEAAFNGGARKCKIVIPGTYFDAYIDSYEGLMCNALPHVTSDLGHKMAHESGTFGLVWYIAKEGNVRCSLRSEGDYDVSAIAKKLGGGGHKNAAGFEIELNELVRWMI